ncbi:MAG: 4Fe-4S cluster-binding domain-containing protein [Candidatus Omnitrophica bacterium]|nr:4Fe-4S cluster-binding domain-containing protein [Candidatus Omnitrophota bacterium]
MTKSPEANIPYDAWLSFAFTKQCDFQCQYCASNIIRKILKKVSIAHSIKIEKLIDTLGRTKKIFKISFTGGGEPFFIPNILETCAQLTTKHYIDFVTNLISPKIKLLVQSINPKKVLLITASLHIKELERHKLLDVFIAHYHLCKENGFPVIAQEVAYPPLVTEIAYWKKYFKTHNVNFLFVPFSGIHKGKHYPAAYTDKEINQFELDPGVRNSFRHFGKMCNAGHNFGVVSPKGTITTCVDVRTSVGNIYKTIRFRDTLLSCPSQTCTCPAFLYDNALLKKSLS